MPSTPMQMDGPRAGDRAYMTATRSAVSPEPARDRHPWLRHYPTGVDFYQAFAPAPLALLLDQAVARHGARPCSNFLGKQLTYADIGRLVDKTAVGLQALGVRKGTHVGLLLPNSPTFIVYFYAVLKLGGVVVNYNPLYTVDELSFQVTDSDTELMVTLDLKLLYEKVEALLASGVLKRAVVASFPSLLPPAKSVLFRLLKGRELARIPASPQAAKVVLDATVADTKGTLKPAAIDPLNDIAVLQYTGGTTGTPKGAMLTHANISVNLQQSMAWIPGVLEEGSERILAILPFFHIFALTGILNFAVAMGAELIIMPRFAIDDALKLIDRHRPTLMPAVPTLFTAMLSHPGIGSHDLRSLKFCLSGGAPLPLQVKRQFEAITGCKVVEAYGLSEAAPGVTINPPEGPEKDGSIGQPIPGTIVSLRDLDDPTREVAQGERGEICIKGPQVMKGYWNKPEETANQFVGEFLRTGDVGVMDADGFIFIVDRIKDLIICSGYNVYPRNVEEAIHKHPAVAEVTVVGIKDKYRGEAPKAFIKLKPGMTATDREIFKHLEPLLSKIEMPAEIEFRAELPKTIIGKLSKKELKAEESARSDPG